MPSGAIRGPALTFTGDPFRDGLEDTMVYESDAIVAFGDGKITHFGPAAQVRGDLPSGLAIRNYGPDALISAGFLDSHVHFPQTLMIGAFSEQLLDWLNAYAFPTERKFADKALAAWVKRGVDFAATLPKKTSSKKRPAGMKATRKTARR